MLGHSGIESGNILNFPISPVVGAGRAKVVGGAGIRRDLAKPARVAPGGSRTTAYLPIDVFAWFDREYV